MFGDIAGFTAWSSVREPSQVFTLLETVYAAFDVLAKRRRVFKVETVGDCCKLLMAHCSIAYLRICQSLTKGDFNTIPVHCVYQSDVAVTGLPEPRKDHALVMCRFARDCVERFNELVGQLETLLGPDTADLAVRKYNLAIFVPCLLYREIEKQFNPSGLFYYNLCRCRIAFWSSYSWSSSWG